MSRVLSILLISLCCTPFLHAMSVSEAEAARSELQAIHEQLKPQQRAVHLVHKLVGPSVVAISTQRIRRIPLNAHYYYRDLINAGEGSGFIYASDERYSYILTNAHVILQTDHAQNFVFQRGKPIPHDEIAITTQQGRSFEAIYVGADINTDLAVIKVAVPDMPTITWGDSDQAQVGDFVVALGYPFGLGYSVTSGIVSATERYNRRFNKDAPQQASRNFESYIQTDAAINPGNSGGPLVNLGAEVIGVNASIAAPANDRPAGSVGIGFAIPANLARHVADDIREFGHFAMPMLGFRLEQLTEAECDQLGFPGANAVIVSMVFAGTPAADAGFQRGDIITEINSVTISSLQHARSLIASTTIGDASQARVWRAGETKPLHFTPVSVAELRRLLEASTRPPEDAGIVIERFGFTLDQDEQGTLYIRAIEADGPADRAGLRINDRIYVIKELEGSQEPQVIERFFDQRRDVDLLIYRNRRGFWAHLER